jgi:protein-tyrosine-phosphatase
VADEGADEGADGSVAILVVCTANQCRSPLTAIALQARAMGAGLPVTVESAGITAVSGTPATRETVDAARRLGFDLSDHASTPLDARAIADADLIIGLERRHVQEVVVQAPGSFPKTYTLKELVRRGQAVGGRAEGQPIAAWLDQVHAGRRPTDLLGVSPDDDVADPTGSNSVDHLTTAEELDELSEIVLDLLF